MATAKFILRGSNPDIPQSINLMFRYQNKVLKYPTGYKVLANHWNDEKQEVRNKVEAIGRDTINSGLIALKARIVDIYNDMIKENEIIDNISLRYRISGRHITKHVVSPYVQDFLDAYIKKAPTNIIQKPNGKTEPIKPNTIKQLRYTLKLIKAYDMDQKTKTRFVDLDLKFHGLFQGFITKTLRLSPSTCGTRIQDIKTISKYAQIAGIQVNDAVFDRGFFKATNTSQFPYLNEQEIERIALFDFSNEPRLDNARDLFVIGLWTGLRVSDFTVLQTSQIIDGFLEVTQEKTSDSLIIPIHHQVEAIIEKYNGLPKMISAQKFNDYIKEICRIVGINEMTRGTKKVKVVLDIIDPKTGQKKIAMRNQSGTFPKYELISSHICRRSFATNHYDKLPNLAIMAITGHKSEKTFLKYIKVTPKEHAKSLLDYWKTERKESGQAVSRMKIA